jgi:hypothetical protein
VLNEHLSHVGISNGRIDGLLRMLQKFPRGFGEGLIAVVRLIDTRAQGFQYLGQVIRELDDGLAKCVDLRTLIGEE